MKDTRGGSVCQKCGTTNRPGAKYCTNCGENLMKNAKESINNSTGSWSRSSKSRVNESWNNGLASNLLVCKKCGFVNSPSARTCVSCGESLLGATTFKPEPSTKTSSAIEDYKVDPYAKKVIDIYEKDYEKLKRAIRLSELMILAFRGFAFVITFIALVGLFLSFLGVWLYDIYIGGNGSSLAGIFGGLFIYSVFFTYQGWIFIVSLAVASAIGGLLTYFLSKRVGYSGIILGFVVSLFVLLLQYSLLPPSSNGQYSSAFNLLASLVTLFMLLGTFHGARMYYEFRVITDTKLLKSRKLGVGFKTDVFFSRGSGIIPKAFLDSTENLAFKFYLVTRPNYFMISLLEAKKDKRKKNRSANQLSTSKGSILAELHHRAALIKRDYLERGMDRSLYKKELSKL
ncbi:MAG: zinc ribbon domain-containing protein, partial [Nitrososphaerota archaeon]